MHTSSSQRAKPNSPNVKRAAFQEWLLLIATDLFVLLFTIVANSPVVLAQTQNTVVAKVNGHSITQQEVDETVISQLYPLQQQIFALRKAALENLIIRKLLEAEASRRTISVDELKRQMTAGPVDVSAMQVEELYQKNATAFALMSPDEAREKLRLDLEGQARLKKYREALTQLRGAGKIEFLLDEPRLTSLIALDKGAATGPTDAKVVLVEYSDFQCPYCKEVQTTITQILRDYPNDVRLVFKHLPLEIHQFAFQAAQASFCAGRQGVFWPYHDALFDADTLSVELLGSLAAAEGLDIDRFQKCLGSPESRTAVLADIAEARKLGISGTPTFLINGKILRGAVNLRELKALIEIELRSGQTVSNEQTSTSSDKEPQK
jgi:protein-disulfide isomerase